MAQLNYGAQNETLELQPGWTLNTNFDQTITGTGVFKVAKADALANPPRIGDPHPYNQDVRVTNFSLVGGATKYEYHVQYFGLLANPTKALYSYHTGISEEPIETHPNFADFGGTAASPATGAIFDSNGVFEAFNDLAAADLVGVRGYLNGQGTIRRTFYTTSVFTGMEDLTKTRDLSSGVVPGVSDSQNVLKTDWSSDLIGNNFYRVTEEYLLSGTDGWSSTIYESNGNVE